jgi:hypothetical protein
MQFVQGVVLSAWVLEFFFFFMVGYYVLYGVDSRREKANLALQEVAATLKHWKMDDAASIIRHIVAHDWDTAAGEAVNLARLLADPSKAAAKELEIFTEFFGMHVGSKAGQDVIKGLLKDAAVPGVTVV